MRKETQVWEEESVTMASRMKETAPPPVAPETQVEKPPESSASGETARNLEDIDTTGNQNTAYGGYDSVASPHSGEDQSQRSETLHSNM